MVGCNMLYITLISGVSLKFGTLEAEIGLEA
jgi:hypothetical protein